MPHSSAQRLCIPFVIALLGALGIRTSSAQQRPVSQEEPQSEARRAELQQKLDHELAKPFVKFGSWVTDYDEARRRAREEDKIIFAYFSRSYAF